MLWKKILNEGAGTYDFANMGAYQFGTMPCDEMGEEEVVGPRLEFLEEMGQTPKNAAYHYDGSYEVGRSGETEEERAIVIARAKEGRAKLYSGNRVVGYSIRETCGTARWNMRFT